NDSLHPEIRLLDQNLKIAEANIEVQKNSNKPEFSTRLFSQRLWGAKDPLSGFSVSVQIPIFNVSANKNAVKVLQTDKLIAEKQMQYQQQMMQTDKNIIVAQLDKTLALLNFYEGSGLKQANEIIKAATLSYKAGESSFADLSQLMGDAIDIQKNYLDALNQYNQVLIQYNYLNNI
ncbi:MAG: CusA/CzcA family heavy metal efflux RND transporter, partial [Chitinophagaceae bacterium]